jgi:hypothetical protein
MKRSVHIAALHRFKKQMAAEAMFSVLYSELHRMAERQIARHRGGVTLSPTTLLHKTYIDLAEIAAMRNISERTVQRNWDEAASKKGADGTF